MSNGAGADDNVAADARRTGLARYLLIGLLVIAGCGWGLARVVDALDAGPNCGSYGYGGYQQPPSGYGYGEECPPPNHDDATLVVEPATGLVDRQNVTVRGSNFDPDTTFGVAQCDAHAIAASQSTDSCDLSTSLVIRTGPDGSATTSMVVRRIIVVQGVEIDCAVEGACVVGGATIPDGFTPTEAATAPITFDASVPPVPRLEVAITVEKVTSYEVTGTVVCNREASFFANVFVHQTVGNHDRTASGYGEGSSCGPTPTPWSATLVERSAQLAARPVDYTVDGYAYEGFETAEQHVTGTTRLSPGGPPKVEPDTQPGTTVSVSIQGASGDSTGQAIDLVATCGRAADQAYASVVVSQWVGHSFIQGYGSVEFGPCNGATPVSVPVDAFSGALGGGPARVSASVYVAGGDPSAPFSDTASAVDAVTLHARSEPDLVVDPNPESRITITEATRSSISGTVACDTPVTVDLQAYVQQQRGRTVSSTFGQSEIENCSGSRTFTIGLEQELSGGDASVSISAFAYRADGGSIIEYVWDDYQAAQVRVGH